MSPWLALALSAAFEVGWIVSLKLLNGWARPWPIAGYLLFGLLAAVFLSAAMKAIPMGTAYAVWVGLSLVGALAVDVAAFQESWSAFRVACALLIVAGACGLKMDHPRAAASPVAHVERQASGPATSAALPLRPVQRVEEMIRPR